MTSAPMNFDQPIGVWIWFEPPGIVEHVVFGKQTFIDKSKKFAIRNYRRTIKNSPPVRAWIRPDRSDNSGDALRGRNDLLESVKCMLNNVRILKPVLRGVTVCCKFRKHYQVGVLGLGCLDSADYFRD